MGFKDFFIREKTVYVDRYTNEDRRAANISRGVDDMFGTDYRKYTIAELQAALNSAAQVDNMYPSWNEITDIYDNMMLDSQVSALVGTLKDRIKARPFKFNNEADAKFLDAIWFDKFVDFVVDARLRGFELIQLGDYDEELKTFVKVTKAPRKHVKPHLKGVSKNEYDDYVYAYWEKEPYKTWTIYLEHDRIGDLSKAAKWFILKGEVAKFWAMYNQMYGVPPVIGRTQLKDSERKQNLINMLKNFRSGLFGVIDKDDEIETIVGSSTSGSSSDLYERFIRLADEQISKALLYSTMIVDDGSSRSQAEVHERNLNLLIDSYLKTIKAVVNKELIPRMSKIGFPISKGAEIQFEKQPLTFSQEIEKYDMLLQHYHIDAADIKAAFNVDVTDKDVNNG